MYNGTSRLFIDQEPLFPPLQMQYTGKKTKWKYQDVDDNDHLEDDDDHVDEDLEGIEAALGGNLASDRILRRAIQIQIRIPTRYRLSHHCYVAILVTILTKFLFRKCSVVCFSKCVVVVVLVLVCEQLREKAGRS